MKRRICTTIWLFLLFGVLMVNFAAAQENQIEPRYVGIDSIYSALDISSSGKATCTGRVVVKSGYTADVTVELQQDGSTIKTWTDSGAGFIRISKTHYVSSGHGYTVKTSATIYDSNEKIVATMSDTSEEKTY